MAVGSSNDFDLVVLGAGTGGYSAAFRAAQLGLKVALVDEDKIGGTCLHRGCIPTKALLESAAFTDKVRHAKEYGLVLPGEAVVDYAAMAARRDAVVKRMWTGLKTLIDKNKVTWVAGRGRLDGPGKIKVSQTGEDGTPGGGGERILKATDVILATGSRVKSLPGLTPDGKRIVTSDDVLKLDTLPKDIVIVGAGAVGVEFASMYDDVGIKVTLLEYLPQIVPLEDADVSKVVERSFTKRGITVMTNARFDAASVTTDEERHLPDGRPRGQGPGRAPRRGHARRHRPRRQHRGHRPRDDQGRDRARGDQGQRPDADQGAARVRDRRRRSAGCGWPTPPPTRDRSPRTRSPATRTSTRSTTRAATRDLLPAGDRLDRADRGAGEERRPPAQGRQGARSRRSPRRSSAASTRASPRSSPTPRPTTRSASTSSGRTPPT